MFKIIILIFLIYFLFCTFKINKIYDQKIINKKYYDLPKINKLDINNFELKFEPFNNSYIYEFGIYKNFLHENQIDLKLSELRNKMTILDMGSGLLGPAIYFSNKLKDIKIHAITNCNNYYKKEIKYLINKKKKNDKIIPHFNDFNNIDKIFKHILFDRILFIESINYSENINLLISKCNNLLKKKGLIYIRTLIVPKTTNKYLLECYDDIKKKLDMNLYTHENIISVLQNNKFENIKFSSIPFILSDNFLNIYFYLSLKKLKLLKYNYLISSLPILTYIYLGMKI